MEKTSTLLKPTLLVVLAAMAGTAGAASATFVGTPEGKPAIVDTVGLDVDAGAALKSIVPENWGVLVHKNSTLPPKLSWSEGKDWVTTITNVLEPYRMNVKVDWNKKTVYVKKQLEPIAVMPVLEDAPPIQKAPEVKAEEFKLVFAKGQRLSTSLDKLLQSAGYRGKYEYIMNDTDLESEEDSEFVGASIKDVLDKALGKIGLTADIYKPSKLVVVKYRDEVAK